MRRNLLLLFTLLLGLCCSGFGQELDGVQHPFHDDLLDHLSGNWNLTGKIAGSEAAHTIHAEWVLHHQFLLFHEKEPAPQKNGAVPYEAMVFIGYDNASERYVAHWIDVFGGRIDETLGYGTRTGNAINFVFEYPDGPFHTSFIWQPEQHSWHMLMSQRDQSGKWQSFADATLALNSETAK